MQRLRSPFRLRPGPGSEHRKGKTRRDQATNPHDEDSASAAAGRSSSESGAAEPGLHEPRGRHNTTTPALLQSGENERHAGDESSSTPDGEPAAK